jgi:hypothetical protein
MNLLHINPRLFLPDPPAKRDLTVEQWRAYFDRRFTATVKFHRLIPRLPLVNPRPPVRYDDYDKNFLNA